MGRAGGIACSVAMVVVMIWVTGTKCQVLFGLLLGRADLGLKSWIFSKTVSQTRSLPSTHALWPHWSCGRDTRGSQACYSAQGCHAAWEPPPMRCEYRHRLAMPTAGCGYGRRVSAMWHQGLPAPRSLSRGAGNGIHRGEGGGRGAQPPAPPQPLLNHTKGGGGGWRWVGARRHAHWGPPHGCCAL